MTNQAGWECDACRKSGLEKKRRCGWLGGYDDPNAPPVWVRKRVAISTCPKSYVTAESHVLVEDFLVRRRLGGLHSADLSARQVEAFVVLEHELALERTDAQRGAREVV
jgi:hypothetical protein